VLGAGLFSHVGQELLKGEQMAHQALDGQGLEVMLPLEDVQAVSLGIQLQGQVMADELAGDVYCLRSILTMP